LVLLAEGLTNQQSAQKLSISQSTLKFHMTNIFVSAPKRWDAPLMKIGSCE